MNPENISVQAGLTVHTNQAKWNSHKQESDKHDDPPAPIFDLENIEEGIERYGFIVVVFGCTQSDILVACCSRTA